MAATIRAMIGRVRDLWLALSKGPGSLDTPQGRSRDRYRRVALAGFSNLLSRGVSVLTLIVVVPLTVSYLGTERYGMWMTMTSVISFLALMNAGLDTSLLNAIAHAHGKNDRVAARTAATSALVLLVLLAAVSGLVFAAFYDAIDWPALFKVTSPVAVREAGPAMAVFVACILLTLPLGVVTQIQHGYQEGFINALWEGAGRLAALAALLAVVALEGGLVWLVLAMAGLPLVATLMNGAILFDRRRPWLRPSLAAFHWAEARALLRQGAMFFLITLSAGIAYWTDNIIAAQLMGPDAVAEYSVAFRLFSIAAMLIALFMNALWPAYGEALSRGDTEWIVRALGRTVFLSLGLTALVAIPLVLWGRPLIRLWVGGAVAPSADLLVALGVWSVLSAGWLSISVFLNGTRQLRFVLGVSAAMAVGAVGAKLALVPLLGLAGIAWGNVVGFLFFAGVPLAFGLPGILKTVRASARRPGAMEGTPASSFPGDTA